MTKLSVRGVCLEEADLAWRASESRYKGEYLFAAEETVVDLLSKLVYITNIYHCWWNINTGAALCRAIVGIDPS